MHQEINCILCFRVCSISDNQDETKHMTNAKCQTLDDQLTVIFTVAQLLEIPRAFCQNLLLQSGNPSEWMARCDGCNELISSAYKTFKEVHHLQKKYVDLKLSIKTRVLNSRTLNSVNTQNKVTKTTEKIRKYVFKDLPPVNCEPKLDPDVALDNVVIKTDPDLVLKEENDIDIQEENACAQENFDDHHEMSLSNDIFEASAYKELSNRQDNEEGDDSDSDGEQDEDSKDRDWEGDDNSENSDSENEESRPEATKENGSIRPRLNQLPIHKCLRCEASFSRRSSLRAHYRRKHPEEKEDVRNISRNKVKCDVCGQEYGHHYINVHKRSHSENYVKPPKRARKFECEECGAKFRRLVELETHTASRHMDVPYKCLICNVTFTSRSGHYKHHKKMHPEDKEGLKKIPSSKIKCDGCDKSFSEDYLREHRKTHEEGYDPEKDKIIKKYSCNYCEMTFRRPNRLERHIAVKHKKDLPFNCSKCKMAFTNFTSLRKHLRRIHPDISGRIPAPRVPCEICGQLFSEEYIKTHMVLHPERNEKKFKCELCEDGFNIEEELEIHKRGVHFKELNLEPYECKECAKTFKSDKWLQCHNIKEHSSAGTKPSCPICDKQFSSMKLKRHIEMVHEREKFPCAQCNRVFNSKDRLEVHVTSQHQKNYECEICKKLFQRMDLFRYHQRGKHYQELNLEPIQCEECGKIFTSHKSLGKHSVHTHTKDFKEFCSICNLGCFDKTALSVHIRKVHDKERNFTCSFCGMGFFKNTVLQMHVIAKHTMEYAVTCEICGQGSASEGSHKKHMKRHGTKGYACEICGEAYAMQYELQDHQRGRHYQELGLEPFQCTECHKIYTNRSSMLLHFKREHTNAPKLQCSYCEKQFMSNQRLREHTRKHHTGEKPYQCELCGDAFFTMPQKRKHFQIHNLP